ncbi:MAG: hypothetical protein AUH12_06725 [Gemmatimonadetes bacterium 13_2_20CM_69_8]|nr:MAG: hypothetical protein AUH12_06725 [Gemmatimonadetes bacterium 13_2_20CM_69_8]
MTFLHPWALVGLTAAAIPALLHLLERRVPPDAEFPPIRYLTEAERQSARRLKLRHLLLLILRTALIALLVIAAARPLVQSRGGGAGAGGAHEPTALVLILDNSPSAGAVVDGRPVLARLKRVARASIAGATAADRVWLMLADGVARAGSREALLATVDSAEPAWRRLDLTAAVARAVRLVNAEPLPWREVQVVSDLQRTAFGEGRASVPRGVGVLALAPLGQASLNWGVAAARVTDGVLGVTLSGTSGAGPAPLTVRLRGRTVGRMLAAPGASVPIPLPSVAPGWWVGDVALDRCAGGARRGPVYRGRAGRAAARKTGRRGCRRCGRGAAAERGGENGPAAARGSGSRRSSEPGARDARRTLAVRRGRDAGAGRDGESRGRQRHPGRAAVSAGGHWRWGEGERRRRRRHR